MGNPSWYYKKCLQNFAHALVFMENPKLAKEISKEISEEKLENFIMEQKSKMDEKHFYFSAGEACRFTLDDADRYEGNDAFNACIGGCCEFEYFLGLREDEDHT